MVSWWMGEEVDDVRLLPEIAWMSAEGVWLHWRGGG